MSKRVTYELGSVEWVYADDASIEVDRVRFHYPLSPKYTPRDWTVELVFRGKRQLLPALHASQVSPLGVNELLRFTIGDPIIFEYKPLAELAARLDMVEDESALVADDTGLNAWLRPDALDLRNYEFESGFQGPQS